MSSRTLTYLLQSDPDCGAPRRLDPSESYTFDISVVGAVAIKEMVQTCRSGTSLAPLINALLAGRDGGALVWKENGPGVGWEMRNAWSGLFGRFFARTYMEMQGYTWFHPVERAYDSATDDLVITRVSDGNLADWVCAKDGDGVQQGEVVIVEAKGRHREGNARLQQLPRPLRNALDQIRNTFVRYRDSAGTLQPKTAKGYAILTKWTNESKGPRTQALIRVVDPDTSGFDFSLEERKKVVVGIGQSHVSRMLRGMGYDALAFASSPVKRTMDPHEAAAVLKEVHAIVSSRASSFAESVERKWMSEDEWKIVRTSKKKADELTKMLDKEIRKFEKQKAAIDRGLDRRLSEKAKSPLVVAQVSQDGISNEKFVGEIIGISGKLVTPMETALRHIQALPIDMADQFVFVGVSVKTLEGALEGEVCPWAIDKDVQDAARKGGVHVFGDGTIIAPASRMTTALRTQTFL